MSRATARQSRNSGAPAPKAAPGAKAAPRPRIWITQAAFFFSLMLVIARMTMTEGFRNDTLPVPGGPPVPAAPGPASGIVLDLLCCLPALLVLARRMLDGTMLLRPSWAHWPMLLLGAWTLASVLWASDKFAAVVSASHWLSALVLLWSTSQLVRGWVRLRLLAAVAFGLLLVLLVQGYYYRFVDLPDLQREWRGHSERMLQEHGSAAGSREAIQLGKNIESGQVTGFSVSRNTYAAVLVLLMVIAGGFVIQRRADRDHVGWAMVVAIGVAIGLPMLYLFVQSKTAYLTPVIAVVLLIAIVRYRSWIVAQARRIYWALVALLLFAGAAIVGHGLCHGTLFHISLTFRWQYWVGAARVFVHHPVFGVGWANFGPHYLAARLPQAAEEPSDPHNFLVRAFVELGAIGGVLMLVWMLRLWWELTQNPLNPAAATGVRATPGGAAPLRSPTTPGSKAGFNPYGARVAIPYIIALAVASMLANAAVSINWNQWNQRDGGAWIFLEAFKRLLYMLALLLGMFAVAIRSGKEQELDGRPAPWLLCAMLVGLALFLLHNLIDFSMFETGPMFLFALLAGGVLGLRLKEPVSRRLGHLGAGAMLTIASIEWIVAAGAGALPIIEAENLAQQADRDIRANKLEAARSELIAAFRRVPINADYAFRAEQVAMLAGANSLLSRQLLDGAIAADPVSAKYRHARAQLEILLGDLDGAWQDYAQSLHLDPNNLDLRLEYADQLREHRLLDEARRQYRQVLDLNAKLASDEIKRLAPERVAAIERLVAR